MGLFTKDRPWDERKELKRRAGRKGDKQAPGTGLSRMTVPEFFPGTFRGPSLCRPRGLSPHAPLVFGRPLSLLPSQRLAGRCATV